MMPFEAFLLVLTLVSLANLANLSLEVISRQLEENADK
jgi:hypothetical protein